MYIDIKNVVNREVEEVRNRYWVYNLLSTPEVINSLNLIKNKCDELIAYNFQMVRVDDRRGSLRSIEFRSIGSHVESICVSDIWNNTQFLELMRKKIPRSVVADAEAIDFSIQTRVSELKMLRHKFVNAKDFDELKMVILVHYRKLDNIFKLIDSATTIAFEDYMLRKSDLDNM